MGSSETKLNDIHRDSAFEIQGYQKPFRRDRKSNMGGGLLVYVKDGVCCRQRSDLENTLYKSGMYMGRNKASQK